MAQIKRSKAWNEDFLGTINNFNNPGPLVKNYTLFRFHDNSVDSHRVSSQSRHSFFRNTVINSRTELNFIYLDSFGIYQRYIHAFYSFSFSLLSMQLVNTCSHLFRKFPPVNKSRQKCIKFALQLLRVFPLIGVITPMYQGPIKTL